MEVEHVLNHTCDYHRHTGSDATTHWLTFYHGCLEAYLPPWFPRTYPHQICSTTLRWWMDGEGPNVNERHAGWTQPACDLVSLSHHILAVCLLCIRGLCWPPLLPPVKFKLDALNSKPIFCQCQLRVLAMLLALCQCHLFPVVVQLMRAYSGREGITRTNPHLGIHSLCNCFVCVLHLRTMFWNVHSLLPPCSPVCL